MKSDPEIVERNGQRTYVFDKADHPGTMAMSVW
jgi:hypothetical protein